MSLDRLLAAASDLLDDKIMAEGPAHLMRIRVEKIHEEAGEVEAAMIGVEGSNPRKGSTHTLDDLEGELLDVALTALLAFYHVSRSAPVASFERHAIDKIERYYGITLESLDGLTP